MKRNPVLFIAQIWVGLSASSLAQIVGHAQGELAGEVSASSVFLQSRLTSIQGPELDADGDIPGSTGIACFEYSENSDFTHSKRTPWIHAQAKNDFIVRAKVESLTHGTIYHYRLVFGLDQSSTKIGAIRKFKTLNPTDPKTSVSFCMGNCMNYNAFMSGVANGNGPVTATEQDKQLGYPVFSAMKAMHPDFFIGAGDAVYYDQPAPTAAQTLPQLRKKWHEQFRFPRMIEFFGSCAAYWEKDDHDFRFDDADLTDKKLPTSVTGIQIFREQLPVCDANNQSTPTYRTQRVHKNLQLWFIEGRDYRSNNRMPDGPEKSIWGTEQKRWLETTLKESDSTWKIIITPTPMVGPDRTNKTDNHADPGGFQFEAETFFHWLIDHKITNVIIFCGDRHWQYHSIHPLGFEEFSVGALNDENSITGERPGSKTSTDPKSLIKQPYIYTEPTGGFVHTTINPNGQLIIGFHDDTGKLLHKVEKSPSR